MSIKIISTAPVKAGKVPINTSRFTEASSGYSVTITSHNLSPVAPSTQSKARPVKRFGHRLTRRSRRSK